MYRRKDMGMMHDENSELKLSFIRKVYYIIIFQLLLTIAVVSTILFVPPIANFFNNYVPYYVLGIVTIFAFYYRELGYFYLLIFTVSLALSIGLICNLCSGKIILETVTLTATVVISLSLYTFWTAKRGDDFSFLDTFLTGAGLVVGLLTLFKILYPSGKLSNMIYGCLGTITFYGYIVYDTDKLIKRFTYGKYISVAVNLYLDVIPIFLCLLLILIVAENKNVV
ncbi:hypothetical protein P8452_05956 [Trifolium repens]|nr:hypothetical protein P8452_05956 [Trifolium repens]